LQYTLWFGKNGIVDFNQVESEIQVQQQVNQNLQTRNNEMFAEIDDLRQGLDAIEERARHELGMIQDGETFYRIIGEDNQ
jgi:cell division protein FtsB